MRHVKPASDGCWLWSGASTNWGYGEIKPKPSRKRVLAHRMAWLIYRGDIPEGLHVCHKCDVRLCVNPDHLFLGTRADNINDMLAKGRNAKGEMYPKAKLNIESVLEIRASDESGDTLAKRFGVSKTTLSMARNRKTWKHI